MGALRTLERMRDTAQQKALACRNAIPILRALPEHLPRPEIDYDGDNAVLLEWSDEPDSTSCLTLSVDECGWVDWAILLDRGKDRPSIRAHGRDEVGSFLKADRIGAFFKEIAG